ncbi:MAG TPA: MarR family transcriptional regulator [Acidimicrobiales bacterium]|nr:MarR family transcriptional regulator [Acidimicrobiales bacterium]
MPAEERDAVDRIAGQWAATRPDVDVFPMTVIGRLSRLSRLVDRRLAENFARFGIENWMYDVLATLRRSGEPYELTAGDLVRQSMVTTGAITNRIDRLEQRGLVERARTDDRRKVIVRLTPQGLDLVDRVIGDHLATERQILSALSPRQQRELARLLRTALLGLGDHAGPGPAGAPPTAPSPEPAPAPSPAPAPEPGRRRRPAP